MSEYGMAIYNPDGSVYFKTGNNTLVEVISDKVISIHTADKVRNERVVKDFGISYAEVWYDYDFSSVIRGIRNPEILAYEGIVLVPYGLVDYGGDLNGDYTKFGDLFFKWNGNVLSLGALLSEVRGKHPFFSGGIVNYRLFGVI